MYAFGPNADCGSGDCAQANCMGYTNLTEDQKAKVDQLRDEMLPLRQQMAAKRSEIMSLRSQQNPDLYVIARRIKEVKTGKEIVFRDTLCRPMWQGMRNR